ncbi:PspC domain-containing protein [candidate division KSB1 bacterium]|nr:PspC domain-containing protein [candidate division KSB1 bacterium]
MTDTNKTKKLYRSGVDQMIGGVCAGVAEYVNIDITIVRIIWLLSVLVNGIGLIAYLICLVFVPLNPEHAALPAGERKRPGNTGLFIGIALIFIGFLFIFNNFFGHLRMFHWHWFGFWPFQWHLIWPILIIGFGVWYIIYTLQKDKAVKEGKQSAAVPGGQKLFRSKTTRMIAGVCGGLANYWNVDVTLIRIGFVIVTLATHFVFGIGVYIALIILAPEEELKPAAAAPVKSQPPKKTEQSKTKKTEGKNE